MTTKITSSGIIRDADRPRAGIVSVNSLSHDVVDDALADAIDTGYEQSREETFMQIRHENPNSSDDEIEELVRESLDMIETSGPFLLGSWHKNADGLYEPDTSGEFSAEYSPESGVVSVEWSVHITKCAHTSPCYVMSDGRGPCGDLDTPGDSVIAYTLPSDWWAALV